MGDKEPPRLFQYDDDEITQTIDLDNLFRRDITSSGSFDLRGVQATALGRLMHALPIPALIVDASHHVVFVNEIWETNQESNHAITGRRFVSLFPNPDIAQKVGSLLGKAFAERKSQVTEVRITMGSRRIWGRMHLRSVRMANQRFVLVLIQDLTPEKQQLYLSKQLSDQLRSAREVLEQKVSERTAELVATNRQLEAEISQRARAEEKLRQSEDLYRTLVEDSFDGIFVHADGMIVFANSRLYEMLGYEPGELEGQDQRSIFSSEDEQAVELASTGAHDEDLFGNDDIRLLRKDGSTIEVEISARIIQFGGSPAVRVCVRDIAARKRAEELLLQAERTRTISEMAGGVAHNFNNLLQIVMSCAQMASTYQKSGSYGLLQKNIDRIMESAQLGAETVKRLQDFARVPGPDELSGARVLDLSVTVERAIKTAEPWWKTEPDRRGIAIDMHLDLGTDCLVKGKESELFEVVLNLVKNAAEALQSGGEMVVSTFNRGNLVYLTVRDNGIGIHEQNLGKAFEPFWTTKGYHGTGMGLASSYGIVKRHRGEISLFSKQGQGTTVTITLPATFDPIQESAPPAERETPGSLRMLLVDDVEQAVTLLQEGLEAFGHEAVTALSGFEAIDRFSAEQFDVVICDLGMPGMNGWQVGRAISSACAKTGRPKPPFILLTGWGGQVAESTQMAESGVDRVVEKPVDFPRLMDVVRELVL